LTRNLSHLEPKPYIDKHIELVERCKLCDRKAQYELYKLYSNTMLNVSFRIINHDAEAEDVLQEAFLDAFSNLQSFRGQSTFGAWLKQIVVNRAINHVRQRKMQHVGIDDFDEEDSHFEATESIDEEQIAFDIGRVKKALAQLPEGYRLVLSLYLFEGYDHEEISNILNISEITSRSQFMRGKKKLLEMLRV
jgi:RNA polymerase sigma factor (sigma-70 family)